VDGSESGGRGMRKRPPIFQIGFNKAGTRSLAQMIADSGVGVRKYEKGLVAHLIHERLRRGQEPLADFSEADEYFGDMEGHRTEPNVEAFRYFRELWQWYPDAYFILNTRDEDGWIKSRFASGKKRVERHTKYLGAKDERELEQIWRADWRRHHAQVEEFFSRVGGRLLVFEITDDAQAVARFLAPDYEIDPKHYGHLGATSRKKNG